MSEIITVKPEFSSEDCFRIVERHKRRFTYPLHRHKAVELNFIQNGKGVRRVVGDSSEEIGDYEIALIGEDIEHAWEQGECSSEDVREITIHFPANLFDGNLIEKKQFASIKEMIKDSRHGITFGMSAILKVYTLLDSISSEKSSFEQFLIFERILHTLSKSDYRLLTSKSSTGPEHGANPDKIGFIKEYLKLNYSKNIRLSQLSELTGLSTTSIARLFKQRSGMTLSSYLIDLKCQSAARSLVDTSDRIADICKACGFNNLSNFNRIFKSRMGKTPQEYRNLYKKNRISV